MSIGDLVRVVLAVIATLGAEIHRQTQCSRPTICHLLQDLETAGQVDITGPGGRLSYQLKDAPHPPASREPQGGTSG